MSGVEQAEVLTSSVLDCILKDASLTPILNWSPPNDVKYWFNSGTMERLRELSKELEEKGLDRTIYCSAVPVGKDKTRANVYYTPVDARYVPTFS